MRFTTLYKFIVLLGIMVAMFACNKLVEIPEPQDSITTAETFAKDGTANSAILGIYSHMSDPNVMRYSNGLTTVDPGMSADELNTVGIPAYQNNSILADDGDVISGFWTPAYFDIYMSNAAIAGLESSSTVSAGLKSQLLGEAKFIRAFSHFYLVNLFGNIPLVTTIDWAAINNLPQAPASKVYEQIITDLKDAQNLLAQDYSYSNGERIRANSWAATALLARVYLYNKDWKSAEDEAASVINSGVYTLVDLNSVFLKNSLESIFQLQTMDLGNFSTMEGYNFIPANLTSDYPQDVVDNAPWAFVPFYFLTNDLLNLFEPGDGRLTSYVDTTGPIQGTKYYFPYKYKVRQGSPGNETEYYTVLRLAEQYLIRAEARAQQNNLSGAVDDLNIIRARAGLSPLPSSLSQDEVLGAVAKERRIELLAEWGHRWLDLKRTGQADAVLRPIKSQWSSSDTLYPIPRSEFITDPNLNQNPGY